jgi:hypothetical protein
VCRRRTSAATAATSTGLVVSTVISGPMPTGRSVVFFHRGQRQRPLVDLRVEAGLDHHVARASRERPKYRKGRGAQPPRPSSVEPALARDVQGVVQRHPDHVLGHQRVAELRCQREGEAALPRPGLPEIYTIWMTTGGALSSRLRAGWMRAAGCRRRLRIMKLTEETGEVTQAVIGAMGQNPCKGVTHTRDEMLPLASRNPNDGREGQGPFEMADLRV